jgi:hypothetical protein
LSELINTECLSIDDQGMPIQDNAKYRSSDPLRGVIDEVVPHRIVRKANSDEIQVILAFDTGSRVPARKALIERAATQGDAYVVEQEDAVIAVGVLEYLPMQALLLKTGFAESGIVYNLDAGDPEVIYYQEIIPKTRDIAEAS